MRRNDKLNKILMWVVLASMSAALGFGKQNAETRARIAAAQRARWAKVERRLISSI
jgi:hypothetical protein